MIMGLAYIFGGSALRCLLICPIGYILAMLTIKIFTKKTVSGGLKSFFKIWLGLSLFFGVFYYKDAGEVPPSVIFYTSYVIYIFNMIMKITRK